MSSSSATVETTPAEGEPWGDAPTAEATEFFRATIAEWRCRDCGTEFSVESVLDVNRQLGRSVSCPMCDGDSVDRRGGGA